VSGCVAALRAIHHRPVRQPEAVRELIVAQGEAEPEAIDHAAPFLAQHGATFLAQLQERAELVEAEFGAIGAIEFRRSFVACLAQARDIIESLLLTHLVTNTERKRDTDGAFGHVVG